MKVLLLAKKSYDFQNDNGEQVKGNKLFYIVEDVTEGIEGYAPMQVSLSNADGIDILPGYYDFDFTMKLGRNNKPELVLKSYTFLNECNKLFK